MRVTIQATEGRRVRLSRKIVLGDGTKPTVQTASVEVTPFIEQLMRWGDIEIVPDVRAPATPTAPAIAVKPAPPVTITEKAVS